MRIAERLEMFEFDNNTKMCPVLIWDDEDAVLIDTCLPGNEERLINAIQSAGIEPDRLSAIILTHQDMDHIGCVKPLIERHPGIKVIAHEAEAPYIQGDKTPVKVENMARGITENTPEEERSFFEQFKGAFVKRAVHIDEPLADGQKLPMCGGITVIHTPGHTPGHMCLFLERDNVLVVGDALNISEGKLVGPSEQYTADMDQALCSLAKLTDVPAETVICFHGGAYKGKAEL